MLKAAGIAAGVAVFAFIGTPASAGAVTIPDSNAGVDFDAGCLVGNPAASVPEANNVPSPGVNPDCLVSTYDGSTEATDLYEATLTSAPSGADTMLSAEFAINSALPDAGSTCNPQVSSACVDLPNNNFVGVGYKMLYQNPARQNNTPTTAVGGGCPRNPVGQVFDQHEHWLDGYHHFLGFDAVFDGSKWIYSAQVGSYDPAPDGAFFFTELGTASSTDALGNPVFVPSDPAMPYGTLWSVLVTRGPGTLLTYLVLAHGLVASSNINCAPGTNFHTIYAVPGDTLVNIKALSTADSTVTLPVTVPLSLVPGFSDITSIGGFIFFSDITAGNSEHSGTVGNAIASAGGDDNLSATPTLCINEGTLGNRLCVSYTGGSVGPSDTLGDSPACPTPTFGGTLPTNPLLNPAVGCQYDDDNVPIPNVANPTGPWVSFNPGERGTFNPEWWDTDYSIVA